LNPENQTDPLPQELQASLRSLAGRKAPPELWDRVVLARLEEIPAPKGLWTRVAAELAPLFHPGRAPIEPSRELRPVLSFRRLAAAAALLLTAAGVLLPGGNPVRGSREKLALAPRDGIKAFYRSRVTTLKVDPSQLSPLARDLAGSLGPALGEEES